MILFSHIGLLVLTVVALLLAWRELRAQDAQLSEFRTRLDEFDRQQQLHGQSISGLTAGAIGVDRRLHRLETREQVLSERQENLEIRHTDELPYDRAIRLVQQGAGRRRLIEELDLSESEASLIVRLHGGVEEQSASGA